MTIEEKRTQSAGKRKTAWTNHETEAWLLRQAQTREDSDGEGEETDEEEAEGEDADMGM